MVAKLTASPASIPCEVHVTTPGLAFVIVTVDAAKFGPMTAREGEEKAVKRID